MRSEIGSGGTAGRLLFWLSVQSGCGVRGNGSPAERWLGVQMIGEGGDAWVKRNGVVGVGGGAVGAKWLPCAGKTQRHDYVAAFFAISFSTAASAMRREAPATGVWRANGGCERGHDSQCGAFLLFVCCFLYPRPL